MALKKDIKVAILGGGINSAVGRAHIAALRLTGRCEIVGGCFSRNLKLNERSSVEYRIPDNSITSCLTDFIDWCRAIQPDLIILLTPTNLHYQHLISISELNIPVVVEKALATSTAEALDLVKIFEDKSITQYVMFNYVGYPMLREMKAMIGNWKRGQIKSIKMQMPQDSYIRVDKNGLFLYPQDWRMKDYAIPTISLDLGVHLFSILQYLLGDAIHFVKKVKTENNLGRIPNIVDDIIILGESDSGIVFDFWYSKAALGHKNGLSVQVYGFEQSIEWIQEYPDELQVSGQFGDRSILRRGDSSLTVANQPRYTRFKGGHPTGFIEAMANYYDDIFDDHLKVFQSESINQEIEKTFDFRLAYEGLTFLS